LFNKIRFENNIILRFGLFLRLLLVLRVKR